MAKAIIFPSFNEFNNLKIIIPKLLHTISENDLVIICDDSENNQKKEISKYVNNFRQIRYLPGRVKSGRGKAIRRGMTWLIENYENTFTHVLEADCDGSHRVEDILFLLNYNRNYDLVIGSRYLSTSKINGWPITRKIFSRFLNFFIPKLIKVEVKDVTNGLRRYSIRACKLLVKNKNYSNGFIYLSEQLIVLKESGIYPKEIPIVFEPRISGDSSVGIKELIKSIFEMIKLIIKRKQIGKFN